MEPKNSFVMYTEYRQHIGRLTDEEAGRLLKAVMDFAASARAEPMGGAEGMAFSFICAQMERDAKKYEETQRKRSEAGRMGGRPPKAKEAPAFFAGGEKAAEPVDGDGSGSDSGDGSVDGSADASVDVTGDGDGAQGAGFERFWAAYPRREGKQAARAAWAAVGPDEALLAVILAAVARQKRGAQWKKDDGQFVPHPAKWLEARRWEDEVVEERDFLAERGYVPLPRGKAGR